MVAVQVDNQDAKGGTPCASSSVASRIRNVFSLKGSGGSVAVEALVCAMENDVSVLVQHEAAYCLGQMGDKSAIPHLERTLRDQHHDVIVRHEAAEALGAIGDPTAIPVLVEYSRDIHPVEVSETCVLALERIRMSTVDDESGPQDDDMSCSEGVAQEVVYSSVDPAPPTVGGSAASVPELCSALCDAHSDMFSRYRAMFALRNIGGEAAVQALCQGLACEKASALFRHEVAFVLGQMQHPSSVGALAAALGDHGEHEMVRHEAAEALGSIASTDAESILERFKNDDSVVVRESVLVALDISDYVADSSVLHYASTSPGVEAPATCGSN